MSQTARISTHYVEEPVFFPADTKSFFGLLAQPSNGVRSGTGVMMMAGVGGGTTTIGRNRIWVRIARALAEDGHSSLRVDYHGLGDSAEDDTGYALEKPALAEANAGHELLMARGAERLIPIGTCYGARSVIAAAAADPNVKGVLLLAPPIRDGTKGVGGVHHLSDYMESTDLAKKAVTARSLRKLVTSPRARKMAVRIVKEKVRKATGRSAGPEERQRDAAAGFARPLLQVLDRGAPVHLMFGTEDYTWTEYQVACERGLGARLERYSDLLTVSTVPGIIRGFTSDRVQDAVLETALEFIGGHGK